MDIPILFSADPVVVPAKVYEKIWIERVEIEAPSPIADATARVTLRRFFLDQHGQPEFEANSTVLEVQNILQTSQTDPDLAAAVTSLMAYIGKVGVAAGVVAQP
jgi:hypothetical protein